MTITRGQPWGVAVACPDSVTVVPDDRRLGDWVRSARARGAPIPDVGVAGGDMARTAGGGHGGRPHDAFVPVDALRVDHDAGVTWAVSHVVARQSWLRGRVVLVMNAQFLGPYDVAPRGHPNDGFVDVVDVAAGMPWRQRLTARGKARTGSHVPHPHIATQRLSSFSTTLGPHTVVWVDGVRVGTSRRITVTVEADAFNLYV